VNAWPGPRGLGPEYAGRRVVVTGGASFIGSHLTELLLSLGARVTVADDLSSGRREHLAACEADVELHVGDLRDRDVAARVLRGADTVFHLAARHGGRGYIDSHPVDCVGNAALDHSVFQAAADQGVTKVVFASSACTYPVDTVAGTDAAEDRLREDGAGFSVPGTAFADGEYGWAKLYGELQLAAFVKEGRFEGAACRLFNAYGERENASHAVVALIGRALARQDPFVVWGDGTQRRAFTYVADTVMGLALAGGLTAFEVVNVGTAQVTTIDELCAMIFELTGWAPERVHHDLDRPVGSHTRVPDNTRVLEVFGWEPSTTLRSGIAATIADCRDRWASGQLAIEDDHLVNAR
jgi:UDP-glucose 4-epimerase